jgi:hypothetical protein
MIGEPIPSLINNNTRNITFDHVILNGKLVVSEKDIPIKTGSLIPENILYLQKKFLYEFQKNTPFDMFFNSNFRGV